MGKKFAEYQKFNLSEINKEVLRNGMKTMFSPKV